MKQYILIFIVIFLYSCNYKTEIVDASIISVDTLFERKIPILEFNNKILQKELDSIVEKEINCYYYKKDTTCFTIWRMPTFVTEDTVLCISSCNFYDVDFSNMDHLDRDHPMEWRKEEIVYGYFKYKNLDFFCYTSCIKFTNLFQEAIDSVKVKNSPLLYIEYEPKVDDSQTQWIYIYKNKQLIEDSKTTCDLVRRSV